VEHVRGLFERSHDLQSQMKAATNAFKLYKKTRLGAALESVRRAKLLPNEGVHPLLAKSLPDEVLGGTR
jgi:ATP-dependent RNA helicase DDX54/DBP10